MPSPVPSPACFFFLCLGRHIPSSLWWAMHITIHHIPPRCPFTAASAPNAARVKAAKWNKPFSLPLPPALLKPPNNMCLAHGCITSHSLFNLSRNIRPKHTCAPFQKPTRLTKNTSLPTPCRSMSARHGFAAAKRLWHGAEEMWHCIAGGVQGSGGGQRAGNSTLTK